MKNLNEIDFNIEKTTMRELNQHEIKDVAGGTMTTVTGTLTVTLTVTITGTTLTTTCTTGCNAE